MSALRAGLSLAIVGSGAVTITVWRRPFQPVGQTRVLLDRAPPSDVTG